MGLIQITTVLFRNKISLKEISFFRGCIIRLSGDASLFHNHNGNGFNYSYPLIQYKCIKGQAALMGVNEGAEAIECLLRDKTSFSCQLGNREIKMELASINSEKSFICCDKFDNIYKIRHWLPLNGKNYREYLQADGLAANISLLEKILTGNILSFAKGVGIYFDFPVVSRILKLESPCISIYKDVELMSFSAVFGCNVSLPEYIGLGKSASVNHGVVTRIK